jgi:hypothetical protein
MSFRAAVKLTSKLVSAFALVCLISSTAFAATVSGRITNGTTNQPAAGVEVILLNLQATMQPVATTKTDANGHYSLSSDLLGSGPMLLRAIYRGVNYHEPITPGKTTADVSVFEPTDKTTAFTITAHAIILQPNGSGGITVGEEYNISNSTQPPLAYYRPNGSFEFAIPAGAEVSSVTAAGSSGMGVVQTTIDKGRGFKAIDFPFRPGTNLVRITYQLPYPDNKLTLKSASPYPANNVAFFAPPPMVVAADGFSPAGQTQGFNAYMRAMVPANTQVVATISGTAPPPPQSEGASGGGSGAEAPDNSQNPSVNSRADNGTAPLSATITTLPARLDSLKWIVVGGFVALFALGVVFVMRQPALETAGVDIPSDIPARKPAAQSRKAARAASTVSDLDGAVNSSLDQLKDSLFRLELRREAGTISEDDYARERQRLDQRLRELVQG